MLAWAVTESELYLHLAEANRKRRVRRHRMQSLGLFAVLMMAVGITALAAILHTSACWAAL